MIPSAIGYNCLNLFLVNELEFSGLSLALWLFCDMYYIYFTDSDTLTCGDSTRRSKGFLGCVNVHSTSITFSVT